MICKERNFSVDEISHRLKFKDNHNLMMLPMKPFEETTRLIGRLLELCSKKGVVCLSIHEVQHFQWRKKSRSKRRRKMKKRPKTVDYSNCSNLERQEREERQMNCRKERNYIFKAVASYHGAATAGSCWALRRISIISS